MKHCRSFTVFALLIAACSGTDGGAVPSEALDSPPTRPAQHEAQAPAAPPPPATDPKVKAAPAAPAAPTLEDASGQDPRLTLALKARNVRWLRLLAREQLLGFGEGCRSDCRLYEALGGYRVEVAKAKVDDFRARAVELEALAPAWGHLAMPWSKMGRGTCRPSGKCAVHAISRVPTLGRPFTDPVYRGEQPLALPGPVEWALPEKQWMPRYQAEIELAVATCDSKTLLSVIRIGLRSLDLADWTLTGFWLHLGDGQAAPVIRSRVESIQDSLRPVLALFERRCGRPPSWPCWVEPDGCRGVRMRDPTRLD
jgi:hypothetical protein